MRVSPGRAVMIIWKSKILSWNDKSSSANKFFKNNPFIYMVLISKYAQINVKCNTVAVKAIEIIVNCLYWIACHSKINTSVKAKMSHIKTIKQVLYITTALNPANVYL
jgi:hypothetical protein